MGILLVLKSLRPESDMIAVVGCWWLRLMSEVVCSEGLMTRERESGVEELLLCCFSSSHTSSSQAAGAASRRGALAVLRGQTRQLRPEHRARRQSGGQLRYWRVILAGQSPGSLSGTRRCAAPRLGGRKQWLCAISLTSSRSNTRASRDRQSLFVRRAPTLASARVA